MDMSVILGEPVSLGEGQPIFHRKDITHARKSVTSAGCQIMGYSHTQGKDILLFECEDESDADSAMKKICELLGVNVL